MSKKSSDKHLYTLLSNVLDKEVYAGLQPTNPDGKATLPSIVYRRAGSVENEYIDSGSQTYQVIYNIFINAETFDDLADLEDRVANELSKDSQVVRVTSGVDTYDEELSITQRVVGVTLQVVE